MRFSIASAGTLLILICLITSCKNDKPSLAANMDGTDWDFFMIETNGKKESTPAGLEVTMAFLDGKLTGKATCNTYSAEYFIDKDDIRVGEIVATEKYCDNENWDARFVSAIRKAETIKVSDELLSIICKDGTKLSFSKRTLASVTGSESTDVADISELLNLFSDLKPNQLHLYSILVGTNIDVYPFVGETITPNMYELFDASSTSMFRQASMLGAYAIGKLGDLYILRVPGNKGSNSITLYTLKDGKLQVEMPLALANDEPSVNIQQDAWLKDLDQDGKMEIIVRQISAPQGQPGQEVIRVFARTPTGSYQPSTTLKAKTADYPMEKLK